MQAVNSNNYNSPVPKQATKPPLALAKRSAPLPPVSSAKKNVAVISDDDMQEQQSNKPTSTVDPPSRTRKSTNRPPFPAPVKITPVRKVFKEIDLAQSSKIDIFTPRQKKGETAFKKKPRSLLYNIANENTPRGISELMITTSMDGELHFWNAQERKKIKTIGSDHLYDTWIDDICWATPSTLAFCPPQKSEEPVKLIHIGKTSRSNVEGRIQSLDDSPHDSGISVIQSLDTGDNNTQYVEKCSFLTGGYDKSYIWNLKRESPDDNFTTSEVNRLNLKHTSYLLSLCYDKYRSNLFSGGADERLVIFDLQTDSTVREMRLSQRVNQINQSKANPNLMLITLSSCVDQFSVYDQRCPGYDGIKLRFGQHENENLSRYIKLDMHDNGYTVCCGSQSSSKLNFWDLRYTGVSRNISFSMETPSTSKILIPKFIPNSNTIVSVSSTRTLSWLDYQVKKDEIVKTLV
ncbi:WD40-repeat-containing domain protein [Choanephora cucurbitarum]|nr:WD40-repeat-containing domain protein [Choanephora cucurbitarum]